MLALHLVYCNTQFKETSSVFDMFAIYHLLTTIIHITVNKPDPSGSSPGGLNVPPTGNKYSLQKVRGKLVVCSALDRIRILLVCLSFCVFIHLSIDHHFLFQVLVPSM